MSFYAAHTSKADSKTNYCKQATERLLMSFSQLLPDRYMHQLSANAFKGIQGNVHITFYAYCKRTFGALGLVITHA